ncbi:unnamed protein product [Stenotrophomonas maltophilia]|nr:unnamed protein product [Stenotrophomonas maltophilia]
MAGRGGFAGDAVNPSLEAWPRHPCRGHPREPTAGWVRGGRRESIPGGLAAASMPRTPPRTHPAPPLTVSVCVQPRKKERKAKAGRLLRSLCVDQGRHLPVDPRHAWMIHSISDRCADQRSAPTNSRANLSKVGHCGFAGCEPHGCGDQAYKDVLAASPQTHSAPPSHG